MDIKDLKIKNVDESNGISIEEYSKSNNVDYNIDNPISIKQIKSKNPKYDVSINGSIGNFAKDEVTGTKNRIKNEIDDTVSDLIKQYKSYPNRIIMDGLGIVKGNLSSALSQLKQKLNPANVGDILGLTTDKIKSVTGSAKIINTKGSLGPITSSSNIQKNINVANNKSLNSQSKFNGSISSSEGSIQDLNNFHPEFPVDIETLQSDRRNKKGIHEHTENGIRYDISNFISKVPGFQNSNMYKVEFIMNNPNMKFLSEKYNDVWDIEVLCHSSGLPQITNLTTQNAYVSGKKTYATGIDYDNLQFEFTVDEKNRLLEFFNEWQNQCVSRDTYEPRYFDEYTMDIKLHLLSRDLFHKTTYTLVRAFPTVIGNMQLSYNNENQFLSLPVTFDFYTLKIEKV